MAAPARAAAYRVLRALTDGRVDLGDALSRARDPLPDARDRALATELATGTLRWRGALDYQIQRFSAKPLARLDEGVLDALRLAAYQLLHLERVPTSAAVNDAVDLVKSSGFRSAAGFANAVLRRLARERDALTWPGRESMLDHLATVHSHPAWLVARWLDRYGEEVTERWVRFNNDPPSLTVAANRQHGTREDLSAALHLEGIASAPTPIAPHGLLVAGGQVLGSRAFQQGLCVVQDEASQLIPELLDVRDSHRVLDLCASPGGKTIAVAAQCPRGWVMATDVRRRRVDLLASTLARCRLANVHVALIDAHGDLPFRPATFDRVLIDAPCSGLGTIRRDPDIRWRRQAADLATLAGAQRALLHRASDVVAMGGRLVYSTCSSEPEENEQVVAAFLRDHPEFMVVPLSKAGVIDAIARMHTPEGFLRTSPVHGLEAFFGAVLERRAV